METLLYVIVLVLANGDEMRVGQYQGKSACETALIEEAKSFKVFNPTGAYCDVKK